MTVARGPVDYRRDRSGVKRYGTTVSRPVALCGVASCDRRAVELTDLALASGVVRTRPVCYVHGQAFLAAVTALGRRGALRGVVASVRAL